MVLEARALEEAPWRTGRSEPVLGQCFCHLGKFRYHLGPSLAGFGHTLTLFIYMMDIFEKSGFIRDLDFLIRGNAPRHVPTLQFPDV